MDVRSWFLLQRDRDEVGRTPSLLRNVVYAVDLHVGERVLPRSLQDSHCCAVAGNHLSKESPLCLVRFAVKSPQCVYILAVHLNFPGLSAAKSDYISGDKMIPICRARSVEEMQNPGFAPHFDARHFVRKLAGVGVHDSTSELDDASSDFKLNSVEGLSAWRQSCEGGSSLLRPA